MRLTPFATLLTLMLGGCIEDQAKTAFTCRTEALTRADKDSVAETVKCMSLNGYTKRVSKYCPSLPVGDADTICYQPDSWWGRISYQIEMTFR
jgi:hypothetical protein